MPDRRSLLRHLAVLPAMGGVAAAQALPSVTTGDIAAAFREHERLAGIAADLGQVRWVIERGYVEPERPRVLHWHPARSVGGYKWGPQQPNGRYALYVNDSEENLSEMRAAAAFTDAQCEAVPYQGLERRRDIAKQQLAAFEEWQARCKQARDEIGLTKAREEEDVADAAFDAQHARVMAMPANTLQDLAYKAAVIRWHDWDEGDVEHILDRLIELGGIEEAPHG